MGMLAYSWIPNVSLTLNPGGEVIPLNKLSEWLTEEAETGENLSMVLKNKSQDTPKQISDG